MYVVVCGVCAFGDGVLCTYVCVVYVVVCGVWCMCIWWWCVVHIVVACGVHTYMCVLCRMVENPVIQNIKYSEKWLSKSVLHEHMIPYTSLQCL